jgi:hypothetical protein
VVEGGLRDEESAGQVDAENLVPVLVIHLGGDLVDRDSGVVDQDVEPPVLADDLAHHPAAVAGDADAALVGGELLPGWSARMLAANFSAASWLCQ